MASSEPPPKTVYDSFSLNESPKSEHAPPYTSLPTNLESPTLEQTSSTSDSSAVEILDSLTIKDMEDSSAGKKTDSSTVAKMASPKVVVMDSSRVKMIDSSLTLNLLCICPQSETTETATAPASISLAMSSPPTNSQPKVTCQNNKPVQGKQAKANSAIDTAGSDRSPMKTKCPSQLRKWITAVSKTDSTGRCYFELPDRPWLASVVQIDKPSFCDLLLAHWLMPKSLQTFKLTPDEEKIREATACDKIWCIVVDALEKTGDRFIQLAAMGETNPEKMAKIKALAEEARELFLQEILVVIHGHAEMQQTITNLSSELEDAKDKITKVENVKERMDEAVREIVADTDAQIEEKNAKIEETDAKLEEKDAQLAEKDARLAKMVTQLAKYDARLAEKDT